VNTLLADPPAAPGTEQPPASGSPSVLPEGAPDPSAPSQPAAQGPTCARCGAPLQEGQQWCLQCGACEPGSLGERPNWRPLTALALLAVFLAAGAAAAGAAALSKHNKAAPRTTALVPTPAPGASTTTPAAPLPTTTPGATGAGAAGTHTSPKGSANNLLFPPSSTAKPPKLPSPAPTPVPQASGGSTPAESTGSGSPSTTTPASTNTTGTGTTTTESTKSKEGAKSEQSNPILLDTNAATTYNPYNLPEAGFGDPALAIDGEPATAWTAQVQPSSFPSMAEGLLINLRSATKLGRLELATPTLGMTVQVYGANGSKAPATITEPGWTLLSGSHVLKKKVTHLKLRTEGRTFSFLLVWITKAPAASQGTATAPGHVALSEVALYPPSSS
jgi:hypothetical protein